MAFWDKRNKFPYTNNHDANLDYMMTIFENIKNEWHDLYVDLVEWKGTTTLELNTWKTNALAQIEQYETDFRAEIAVWKANTEQDIGVWEQSVLADLGTWRANFETLFATTFSNLSQIKTDAETARDAAVLSAKAAEDSADEAAASAESVSNSLAQIAQNAADVAELKTQINNIVDSETIIHNVPLSNVTLHNDAFMSTDGTETASNLWRYAEYPIPNDAKSFTVTAYAGLQARLWLLKDSSDNVLGFSNYNETPAKRTETIDLSEYSGATKLFVNDEESNYLAISYNTTNQSIKPEKIIINGDTLPDIVDFIIKGSPVNNDVPISDVTIHNNVFMLPNGTDSPESNLWQYAEFSIPEKTVTITVIGEAGQQARLWILKDANNNVLGFSNYDGSPELRTETIDLSLYTAPTKLFINDKKSNALSISYTSIKPTINGNNVFVNGKYLRDILDNHKEDTLYGKVLCCVGDSITYGADMEAEGITNNSDIVVYNSDDYGNFTRTLTGIKKSYGYQIAERHNMTFYNGGVSGSTMQGLQERAGFSRANGRYTKLPDIIDYLTIWFGWNDAAAGTLGTIDDTTNDSYYGGFNVVLPYLINKYPYTKIGLIVPFGATAGHREAVRLLGNKWGLAVWDNYLAGTPLYFDKEESVGVEQSIVSSNRAKFQANGAHPNYKGHTQLGDMIEKWLIGI